MSERMTAGEITELRTLAENACGGPYAAVDNPLRLTLRLDVDEVLAHSRAVRADGCPSRIEMIPQGILHTPDAEYAAAAMQRVPRLLDEIEALQRELAEARGAMAAQDERERKAGERCGVPYGVHGCDWPDAVADRVVELKAQLADAQKVRLIDVTKRGSDYRACLQSNPGAWGCGSSPEDAVGSLVTAHYDLFRVAVKWPNGGTTANHPEATRG